MGALNPELAIDLSPEAIEARRQAKPPEQKVRPQARGPRPTPIPVSARKKKRRDQRKARRANR